MNEIIEKQYAQKKESNNWFLEESIKYGKGYSDTGQYLQVIANKIITNSRNSKDKTDGDDTTAIYIDKF
jgi:hypothetical protein